jgi:hypothetical protein
MMNYSHNNTASRFLFTVHSCQKGIGTVPVGRCRMRQDWGNALLLRLPR